MASDEVTELDRLLADRLRDRRVVFTADLEEEPGGVPLRELTKMANLLPYIDEVPGEGVACRQQDGRVLKAMDDGSGDLLVEDIVEDEEHMLLGHLTGEKWKPSVRPGLADIADPELSRDGLDSLLQVHLAADVAPTYAPCKPIPPGGTPRDLKRRSALPYAGHATDNKRPHLTENRNGPLHLTLAAHEERRCLGEHRGRPPLWSCLLTSLLRFPPCDAPNKTVEGLRVIEATATVEVLTSRLLEKERELGLGTHPGQKHRDHS